MLDELSDGRITIRPHLDSDAAPMLEAVLESVPELSRWFSWAHSGLTQADISEFIASSQADSNQGRAYNFAVIESLTGRYLGACWINQINDIHKFANIGYWIRTSQVGQGHATAATRLTSQFGFARLDIRRIEIVIEILNTGSQRVAEKVGAIREGLLRNRLFTNGAAQDAYMYSLIRKS